MQRSDLGALQNVMAAHDVARLTLENIQNGPTFCSSEYYRANFDRLLAMPRRDALLMLEKMMRK